MPSVDAAHKNSNKRASSCQEPCSAASRVSGSVTVSGRALYEIR